VGFFLQGGFMYLKRLIATLMVGFWSNSWASKDCYLFGDSIFIQIWEGVSYRESADQCKSVMSGSIPLADLEAAYFDTAQSDLAYRDEVELISSTVADRDYLLRIETGQIGRFSVLGNSTGASTTDIDTADGFFTLD
jgi:hypothetical protein